VGEGGTTDQNFILLGLYVGDSKLMKTAFNDTTFIYEFRALKRVLPDDITN
jgi:hypothetical protein